MPCSRSIIVFEDCGHTSRIYINDPGCTGRHTYTEFPRIPQDMIHHRVGSRCPILPANVTDKADWSIVYTEVRFSKGLSHLQCPLCTSGRPTRLSTVADEPMGMEERVRLRSIWHLIGAQNDDYLERIEHEKRRVARRKRWTEDFLANFKEETPRCKYYRQHTFAYDPDLPTVSAYLLQPAEQKEINDGLRCTVCTQPLKQPADSGRKFAKLPCDHHIHRDCAATWLGERKFSTWYGCPHVNSCAERFFVLRPKSWDDQEVAERKVGECEVGDSEVLTEACVGGYIRFDIELKLARDCPLPAMVLADEGMEYYRWE